MNVTPESSADISSIGIKDKFTLIGDLGIITVPEEYIHQGVLGEFTTKIRKMYGSRNPDINDGNFPRPSHILTGGENLHVELFEIKDMAMSDECLAFLDTQNAVYPGAQGATVVFEQKYGLLPKNKRIASFDRKDRLWTDPLMKVRLPYLRIYPSSDSFGLGHFDDIWHEDFIILCFTKA